MRETLRGVIAGCGYFARFHLEAWRRIAGVEIIAACDPDITKAQTFAERAYADSEQMLDAEGPDFIDIVSRPETHVQLIRQASERGVAVICQKPLAPEWEQVLGILDCARATGVRLMIHENWRWQPWYRAARTLVDEGRIGTPLAYCLRMRKGGGGGPDAYPEQPYFRSMKRFLVYEILLHQLDTARFLFGGIRSVFARLSRLNPAIAGEDRGVITVHHASGLIGSIDGHCLRACEGDGGVLGDAWFEGDGGLLSLDPAGNLSLDGRVVWKNGVAAGYRGDSVFAAQSHFVERLRDGRPFETGLEEYLPSIAAMEACYQSAASGREVELSEILPEIRTEF